MKIIKMVALGMVVMGILRLNAAESGLVAEPQRGLAATWPNHTFAGRDLWFMIDPALRGIDGIKDEPMIRDSGLAGIPVTSRVPDAPTPITKENTMFRTLAIRSISIMGAGGGKNFARSAKFSVSSAPDVKSYQLDKINDGNPDTVFVLRGEIEDIQLRFQPIQADVDINLEAAVDIKSIVIDHGVRFDGRICPPSVQAWYDRSWRTVACRAESDGENNRIILHLETAVRTAKIRLTCRARPYLIRMHPERLPYKELRRKYPFSIGEFIRLNRGDFLGLSAENFDRESFQMFLDEYHETFMGFALPEWDSNTTQVQNRKAEAYGVTDANQDHLRKYLPDYTNKHDAVKNWKSFWDYQADLLLGSLYALSGGLAYSQYAAAWGARTIVVENSGMSIRLPVRSMLMFTRGGARQFGVPWGHYIAYFSGMSHPTPVNPGLGKAPSQARRELFTSYYMGANFLQGEGQQLSLLARVEGKEYAPGTTTVRKGETYQLSVNGLTKKEIYEWSKTEAGQRGESYTPILLLVDYAHGRTGRRDWGNGWKTWNYLEFDDGDYMVEQVVRAIDPPLPDDTATNYRYSPPYSANTMNSRLGDVFDVAFANPPQHDGAIKKEYVARYAVAMLLGDVTITPALAERLKEYVREGGTLVVNAAQKLELLNDLEFLGLELTGGKVEDSIKVEMETGSTAGEYRTFTANMDVRRVVLRGAQAVFMSDNNNLPLLTRHQYGQGHVLLATPEYLLLNGANKKVINPFIRKLLAALQMEVLPFQVEGPCQFLMNRIDAGHWKVVFINNSGVIKHPGAGKEYLLDDYAKDMNLVVDADTEVREVLAGADIRFTRRSDKKVASITIPPGQIMVLDVRQQL